MLRFYYDWESPLVKMFWVELWPILLKEFGEELVLNEISSVCTLVARDSTVNSAHCTIFAHYLHCTIQGYTVFAQPADVRPQVLSPTAVLLLQAFG